MDSEMRAYGSIKYGSDVGCWLGDVVRRPAARAQWWVGASSLIACAALAACAVERTPELQENRRTLNGIYIPERMVGDVTDDDRFGRGPDQGPMTPAQVGGMQCGGVFCPFVVAPVEQCCTDAEDVVRGTARAEDLCGLSFANAGPSTFGNGCWQRDQGGVVDSTCEAITSSDGVVLEPGCCSDQGFCGTINTASGVGCHYADGEAKTECGGGIDPDTQCNPLGVFGVRIGVDVAWGGRSGGLVGLTDDGRDELVVHLRVEVDERNGLEISGVARPCSVELPPFYSTTLCESYKAIFPDSIWESAELPLIDVTGRYSCLNPGCVLTIDAKTSLIGIDLDNPESPWPLAQETAAVSCPEGVGVACFLDHDDDDLPGLTINVQRSGRVPSSEAPKGTACGGYYEYWGAPLSASPGALAKTVRRTDRIHLGTRTKLGGSSVLGADCSNGLGTGIAEFVQSRAWGCMVQRGTTDNPFDLIGAGPNEFCQPAEAAFMDENLPIYEVLLVGNTPTPPIQVEDMSPSKGPLISLVRLGDVGEPVSCEDVRNAAYPR